MKNISFPKIEIKNFILITLISFHIFFWDIKFYKYFGLREIIVLGALFYFSKLIKNNFIFSFNRKILYFKILLIFSIFFLHLVANLIKDDIKFDSISILGLLGILFLFFFIENYYDFIRKNLNKIIIFFIICLIISIFISGIQITSEWEKKNLGQCTFFFKFSNLIFKENSHLAMMLPAALGCLFVMTNNIKYKYFYSILFLTFFLLQNSMTLTAGTVILIFLILIFDRRQIKYLIPAFLIFVIFFAVKSYFIDNKNSCFKKLNSTFVALTDVTIKENISFDKSKKRKEKVKKIEIESDNKTIINESDNKTIINKDLKISKKEKYFYNGKVIDVLPNIQHKFYYSSGKEVLRDDKNLFEDYIPKNKAFNDLPRKIYERRFNLSTAVLINALNISLQTLKDRILGWGLNRYERAFDYYMFNTIVIPPFYHEIFTLNYNDGASNFTKSITEFGIISFIFIPLILFFCFTNKVNKYEKIFYLTIIFTQLLRGAGYFNGGFAFSLIFITLTYLKKNEN